jgi:hypothetical protein
MPHQPREILAYDEQGTHLWLLMRTPARHGKPPGDSSWWRKTLSEDELVEVGDRPQQSRPARVKIPALDK